MIKNQLAYYKVIILICLIVSVGRFATDSYLPSFPSIGDYFGIHAAYVQYTMTFFLVGYGSSQLIYGALSEYYGRRKVILFGLSLFALSSLLCALAPSITILILARLLSGLGAGAGQALNRAIATDCFKGSELAKAWSYLSFALVITLIIAPVIGGYVQEWFGWRANFVLISLYVISTTFILFRYLPETHHGKGQSALSLKSAIKTYLHILHCKKFIGYTACSTLAATGLIGYFQLSPFLIMTKLKFSASQYGLFSLYIAAAYLVGGAISNRIVSKLGEQNMVLLGIIVLLLSSLAMSGIHIFYGEDLYTLLIPMMFFITGARIVIPSAFAGAMAPVSHMAGFASALMSSLQVMTTSVISFLITKLPHQSQLSLSLLLTSLSMMALMIFVGLILIKKDRVKKRD